MHRNELDKDCCAHDAAYFDRKDLAKRTNSHKILKDRPYETARNCGYYGYQRALASKVYKFFDKETGSGMRVNEQLAEEWHKPITKKFKRRKVYAIFKDNIWAADLAEMGSLSWKNKNIKYLLCVTDVFTKYTWNKPLKDKKGKAVLNAITEIVNESNRKPNKLWIDQWREFYNKLMQELCNNDILTYATHNRGNSVIAEKFIKTLKSKIYKKCQLMIANLILAIWIN